jgi:UDPglucose--hexose-1-phosphate uridylyltransferase
MATKRQGRTFLPPKDFCPLCPTKNKKIITEIPQSSYDIVVFENKFPTFERKPDKLDFFNNPENKGDFSYSKMQSRGICEVVCYTQKHDLFLEDMPVKKINDLIKVWQDRYFNLGNKSFIKYVFIFENKGKEIGVTLSHPHGQIYAFPYIPPVILGEIKSSEEFYKKNKKCLHCAIIERELNDKSRIVIKNDDFAAFIPFYAGWPYEVHIYSLRHLGSICELEDREIHSLSKTIRQLINGYNKLFSFRMPYVMVMHQRPTDGREHGYYHFHIEFYPPYRTENKLKYMAGCELGAGTFINDTLPEEKAAELRKILEKQKQ